MNDRARALLVAAMVLALCPVGTRAAPSLETAVYGDWTVRCAEREGLPPCDMVQFASERESGEPVMQFSIAYSGNDDVYGVQIRTPLGVLVLSGAAVRVDEEPALLDFSFTRCEAEGCFIERVMTREELEPFRVGANGVLAVIGRGGEPLVIPLSFAGFSEALGVVTERNREWAGQSGS